MTVDSNVVGGEGHMSRGTSKTHGGHSNRMASCGGSALKVGQVIGVAWANLKHDPHRCHVGLVRIFSYLPVAYLHPHCVVHMAELMQSSSVAGRRALLESV